MFDFLSKIKKTGGTCLVIGDFLIDCYMFGSLGRISSEAPLPVVNINSVKNSLGGAGNVVRNLVSLGVKPICLGFIGNDNDGVLVEDLLKKEGADVFFIKSPLKVTTKKTRVVSSGHQISRFDFQRSDFMSKNDSDTLIKYVKEVIEDVDVVVLSDYNCGTLEPSFTLEVIKIANIYSKKVITDPRGSDFSKYSGSYVICPNRKECYEAMGVNILSKQDMFTCLTGMKNKFGIQNPIITLSEDGVVFLKDGKVEIKPAFTREVSDVTGAGDTVIASLAKAFIQGLGIEDAIVFANMVASIAVSKFGTATVTLDEVEKFFVRKSFLNKVVSKQTLLSALQNNEGKKVIFTNGCFDILHFGHLSLLQKAKDMGDILIVGLNSDSSVKKLKGDSRPVNNIKTRSAMLASLSFVDFVIEFDEETPESLIKDIKPNILVKGGDYKEPNLLPGAKYVDSVVIVSFEEGYSTTSTISKIIDRNV